MKGGAKRERYPAKIFFGPLKRGCAKAAIATTIEGKRISSEASRPDPPNCWPAKPGNSSIYFADDTVFTPQAR
jgi:hypothetical protein